MKLSRTMTPQGMRSLLDFRPLSSLASWFLRGTLPRIGGRFFSHWRDAGSFKHRWAESCASAGVQDLHFHDLRHTAATCLAEAAVDYTVTETLLGHRLPGMGERYIHNWKPSLRTAVTTLETVAMERFREAAADERGRDLAKATPHTIQHHQHELPHWWELHPSTSVPFTNHRRSATN